MKRCLRSVIIITKLDADAGGGERYISMNVMPANALMLLAPEANSKARLLALWLCHVDARQVFDLPQSLCETQRSATAKARVRDPIKKESVHGKSKTCPASAWQSHYTSSVDSIHSFNHLLDLREVICEDVICFSFSERLAALRSQLQNLLER